MALYRTDDSVHDLVYRWYGPVFKGFWSLFRFKGRPLTEWVFFVVLFVTAWHFCEPVIEHFAPYDKGPLMHLLLRFSLAWFGVAGPVAKLAYDRFIDSDRDPRYMVRCVAMHCYRQARSRGRVDWAVVAVGFGVWQVLSRVIAAVGLPWIVAWPLAVVSACWVARRIVARVQSPQRAWRYQRARSAAAGRFETIEVSP